MKLKPVYDYLQLFTTSSFFLLAVFYFIPPFYYDLESLFGYEDFNLTRVVSLLVLPLLPIYNYYRNYRVMGIEFAEDNIWIPGFQEKKRTTIQEIRNLYSPFRIMSSQPIGFQLLTAKGKYTFSKKSIKNYTALYLHLEEYHSEKIIDDYQSGAKGCLLILPILLGTFFLHSIPLEKVAKVLPLFPVEVSSLKGTLEHDIKLGLRPDVNGSLNVVLERSTTTSQKYPRSYILLKEYPELIFKYPGNRKLKNEYIGIEDVHYLSKGDVLELKVRTKDLIYNVHKTETPEWFNTTTNKISFYELKVNGILLMKKWGINDVSENSLSQYSLESQ